MATDNSSPSTACIVIFFLWALSAVVSAIAALLFAINDCGQNAVPWMLFAIIAILVSDRYRH